MKKETAKALNALKTELISLSAEKFHPPAISIFSGALAQEIADQLIELGIQPGASHMVEGLAILWSKGQDGETTRTGVELREGDTVITAYIDPLVGVENLEYSNEDQEEKEADQDERACVVHFRQRVEELKRVANLAAWELGNLGERYQDAEINWGHVGSLDLISGGLGQALEALKEMAED